MRPNNRNPPTITGYPRSQSGSTFLELQGLMSEDHNAEYETEVIGKKMQGSERFHTEDNQRITKIGFDSECKPLTDDLEAKCPAEAGVTTTQLDDDLYSNEGANNSNVMNKEHSLTESFPSVKESFNLEITFHSNNENRISRTKEGVRDKENCCTTEVEIVELDLSEAQTSSALRTPTSYLDIPNTADTSDNKTSDEDSTRHSVSIDLSDHVESTHDNHDRDIDLEEDTCRICHCDNEAEILISPCLCTGTVKYVHQACLMDWLKRCVKTKCELCLQNFSVHRKTKPLKKWRRPDQKPTPIIWLLTFVVALTLNIASIAKDGSQKCVSNPCIIFYVVGALGAMLGFAFFYHWLMVSIRYIKQWMALNEEWTLVESDKSKIEGEENLAASNKSIESKDQRSEVQVV